MQGHRRKLAGPYFEALEHRRLLRSFEAAEQCINHHIADEADLFGRDAFAPQVFIGVARRREQEVGKRVGDEAVDLFGHLSVAAAQARFNVCDANRHLGGDQRCRHRRVDIAHDDHPVGPLIKKHLLEGHHDARRLLGVRGGADFEIDVGMGDAEVCKERLAHRFVVMLAGVHQQRLETSGAAAHLVDHRSDFHEVRPRADDVGDFQHGED